MTEAVTAAERLTAVRRLRERERHQQCAEHACHPSSDLPFHPFRHHSVPVAARRRAFPADASLSAVIYERPETVSSQKVLGRGHRCNTMLLLGFFTSGRNRGRTFFCRFAHRPPLSGRPPPYAVDSSIDSHNEFVY
ncbi:hypothetical protein BDI4_2210003 [Burkholderia diffusa]|nr:hypothetical protein BDI4_2210003 [Burkholderia diffusa]